MPDPTQRVSANRTQGLATASQALWPGGNAQLSRVSGCCLQGAGPGLGLVRASEPSLKGFCVVR